MIILRSEELLVDVYPERGFLIGQIRSILVDRNLLWTKVPEESFRGELGPRGLASVARFHREFSGGWFPMYPTAGLPGYIGNEPTWHHGEAARLPWRVSASQDENRVRAEVLLSGDRLNLVRMLSLDRATLTVRSQLTNMGDSAVVWSAGEHPCFDRSAFAGGNILLDSAQSWIPFPHYDPLHASLCAGSRFEWPHAPTLHGHRLDLSKVPHSRCKRHEHVALCLRSSDILVQAPELGINVRLSIDQNLPYMLLWEYFDDKVHDVFAVELCSASGRSVGEAFESDSMQVLEPGAMVEFGLSLRVENCLD